MADDARDVACAAPWREDHVLVGRGRTVRSLATTLINYPPVRMFFVSPEHEKLRLDNALRKRLEAAGVEFHEFDSLDATLDGQSILSLTDCLYMTRIQI